MDTVAILLSSFVLSITGLFVFIWSLRKRLFDTTSAAANVIFSTGEIGRGEEPSATPATARWPGAARANGHAPQPHGRTGKPR
jgi:cbb3-type cytochrome oxidase maturation protein